MLGTVVPTPTIRKVKSSPKQVNLLMRNTIGETKKCAHIFELKSLVDVEEMFDQENCIF